MLDFKIVKKNSATSGHIETSITGKCLLTIPQLNKGTAFSEEERSEFGLTGKLPSHVETLEEQVERAYLQLQSFNTDLQKNTFLNKIHDTNQILFYGLIQNHEAEIIPIIYTPTVSVAVEKFSREFTQVRGLYISYEQRHRIEEILDNRSNPEVDLIVASDGGGVLGIGDQGVGAMLIPVAKLMVYTICGGVNPLRTLPILLDVGTDNEALLSDPLYLGWRHPRITGQAYDDFIDHFVKALKKKLPNVFLQWEDFNRDTARHILDKHRHEICSFNDDIQGTGATTLAALLAAIQVNNSGLSEQRIVIYGAGNAGTGIADQICDGMLRSGISLEEARTKFWLIDRYGLITEGSKDITAEQKLYARKETEFKDSNLSLLEVINTVKPTILIGSSARSGAFTRDVVEAMTQYVERPIIFPLSNPTEKAEAFPSDLLLWSNNRALVATGTPFPAFEIQGKMRKIAQCNNALIFPGIGLAVIAIKAKQVTNNMLWAACEALNQCAPIHKDPEGPILPPIEEAHISARHIAIAVAKQAIADGMAGVVLTTHVETVIDELIWRPEYLPLKKKMI